MFCCPIFLWLASQHQASTNVFAKCQNKREILLQFWTWKCEETFTLCWICSRLGDIKIPSRKVEKYVFNLKFQSCWTLKQIETHHQWKMSTKGDMRGPLPFSMFLVMQSTMGMINGKCLLWQSRKPRLWIPANHTVTLGRKCNYYSADISLAMVKV